jgi:hypothetical protein
MTEEGRPVGAIPPISWKQKIIRLNKKNICKKAEEENVNGGGMRSCSGKKKIKKKKKKLGTCEWPNLRLKLEIEDEDSRMYFEKLETWKPKG